MPLSDPSPSAFGAHDQDRTGDLVLTKDALCRLSYVGARNRRPFPLPNLPCSARWSGRRDSNPRHPAWKAGALPAELHPRRPPRSSRPGCSADSSRPSGPLRAAPRFPGSLLRVLDRPSRPGRSSNGGEGRIRTFEALGATDLQSVAFDRFATSPSALALPRSCRHTVLPRPTGTAPDLARKSRTAADAALREPLDLRGFPGALRGWSWRRELNPRPADYKSAALPLSYASDKRQLYQSGQRLARGMPESSETPHP